MNYNSNYTFLYANTMPANSKKMILTVCAGFLTQYPILFQFIQIYFQLVLGISICLIKKFKFTDGSGWGIGGLEGSYLNKYQLIGQLCFESG